MLQVHFKLYKKEADIALVEDQLEVLCFVVDVGGVLAILCVELCHDGGCDGSGVVPVGESRVQVERGGVVGGHVGVPREAAVLAGVCPCPALGLVALGDGFRCGGGGWAAGLPWWGRVQVVGIGRLASAFSNSHTTCALRLDFSHENLNPDRLIGSR